MPVSRTVWVFGDAKIKIYEEVENTGLLYNPAVPLLEYCFARSVSLSASASFVRRAITGRGRRKIVMISDYEDIKFSCQHLFFDKNTEINFDSIFNSNKQLRVILEFSKVEYSGIEPLNNDIFAMSFARATNFTIAGEDDQNIIATANFEAEVFVDEDAP